MHQMASGLPKSCLLPHIRVVKRSRECAVAALQTMSERAASAKRTNHPRTSQRQTGRKGSPCENAKNVCSGGFAVFARNREQNAHLQLENGSSQMRNVHAFNARSIVAACAKKTRANGDFLVNNPQRMLQTTCATIVTGSVAADATKTKQNYKDFSHAVWDLDVGSPELLCTECVAGQKQEDFGNAPISVAVIRNHIQSSALPSQSMERECIVMLNNVMLAWKDVKKN
jgi:hypothetical protein